MVNFGMVYLEVVYLETVYLKNNVYDLASRRGCLIIFLSFNSFFNIFLSIHQLTIGLIYRYQLYKINLSHSLMCLFLTPAEYSKKGVDDTNREQGKNLSRS